MLSQRLCMHTQLSCGYKCVKVGKSLHRRLYVVSVSNEDSVESTHLCKLFKACAFACEKKVLKSHELAKIFTCDKANLY